MYPHRMLPIQKLQGEMLNLSDHYLFAFFFVFAILVTCHLTFTLILNLFSLPWQKSQLDRHHLGFLVMCFGCNTQLARNLSHRQICVDIHSQCHLLFYLTKLRNKILYDFDLKLSIRPILRISTKSLSFFKQNAV